MTLQDILTDYQPEADFAAELGVSRHTVARYRAEPDGLAYVMLGGRVYIHIPGAKEWMAKRIKRRAPLRRNPQAA